MAALSLTVSPSDSYTLPSSRFLLKRFMVTSNRSLNSRTLDTMKYTPYPRQSALWSGAFAVFPFIGFPVCLSYWYIIRSLSTSLQDAHTNSLLVWNAAFMATFLSDTSGFELFSMSFIPYARSERAAIPKLSLNVMSGIQYSRCLGKSYLNTEGAFVQSGNS